MSGRKVLITGASSGLGEHFGELYARAGADIALAARRIDRLQTVARRIEDMGVRAVAVEMDVADEASVIAAYDAAEAELGLIDTVIANAGTGRAAPAVDFSLADYDALFDINVRGVFLTAREGARRMIGAGARNGRIVLISSIGGLTLLPGLTFYCAGKAAVVMLGQGLAREWSDVGIAVNVVCPGYIMTEMTAPWAQSDAGKRQIASFPRGRLMEASDLDPIMLHLASDSAAGVTGSVFKIDDGQTLPT